MKKLYTRIVLGALLSVLFSVNSYGQTIQLGSGTSTTSTYSSSPVNIWYRNTVCQIVYTAAEINAQGVYGPTDLLELGFYIASSPLYDLPSYTIKMGNTASGNVASALNTTGWTTVKNGFTYSPTSGGYDMITLDTPFSWNGTDNIGIEICWSFVPSYNASGSVRYYSTSSGYRYSWSDYTTMCGYTPSSSNTYKPQVQLVFLPPIPFNAGISEISSPVIPTCELDSTVSTVLVNSGTDSLYEATVYYAVNGVTQGSSTWTGALGTGETSSTISLGSYTFNEGDILTIWNDPVLNGASANLDGDSSNDTIEITVKSGLSGVYTVDLSGSGDYTDFSSGLADALLYGVCDTVIFEGQGGIWNEQLSLETAPNQSASMPIIFRSASGSAATDTINYDGSGNNSFAVDFNDADHFHFENLSLVNTYGNVITIGNGSDSNVVSGCNLSTDVTTTTSTNNAVIYSSGSNDVGNSFIDNYIEGGSYGFYWYGSSSSSLEAGTVIEGNTIKDPYYMGIASYYQDAVNISHNKISSGSSYTSGYGIYLYYNDNHIVVDGNHVFPDSTTTNWPYYGMRIYYCDAQFPASSEIKNNRIVLGGTSTSTRYGMYPYYSDFQTYTNNTVIISAGSTSSRALYHYYGDYNTYYNNAFINLADGYAAYYYSSNSILASDNNAWFSTNMSYLGYASGTVTNLAGFQSGLGMDVNSVVADPIVSDTVNAIFCADSLNNAGRPSIAMYDYEGEMRSSTTPDIGANEYQSAADFNVFDDFVICDNSDSTFTLAYNYDYVLWGTAMDTATSYTVSQAGQYYVQAVGACGTFLDTAQVYAQEQPTLPFNMNICADEVTQISSGITNPAMVSWSTGATTDSIDISAAGVYTVETVDTVGCYSIDSVNVTQSPEVDLPATLDMCENTTEFLDAQIQGSYDWSTGSTNQTILVDSSGSYSVVVTDQFGCVSADTTVVNVIELPDTTYTTSTSFLTVEFFSTNQNGVTYVWDFGDGNTATGANVYHVYDWRGEFTVTLTAYNDCDTNTTVFTVLPDIIDGIEGTDGNVSGVSIFPNPNNGVFSVELSLNTQAQVSYAIMDVQGRMIQQENLGKMSGVNQQQVDMKGYAKGIYILRLDVDGEISTHRVSIQ